MFKSIITGSLCFLSFSAFASESSVVDQLRIQAENYLNYGVPNTSGTFKCEKKFYLDFLPRLRNSAGHKFKCIDSKSRKLIVLMKTDWENTKVNQVIIRGLDQAI